MADISQITIPSGDTYNIKDEVARSTSLPKNVFNGVSVTIPANTTTYTYNLAWITSNTTCYAHDLATKNLYTKISWAFSTGKVTFTLVTALSSSLTFNFRMIDLSKEQ